MKEDRLISKAMAALGRRTSARKAAAARKNGKKGGHPSLFPARKPA